MGAEHDRRHVLFVDDEPSMHRRIERSLRDADIRLTCASDGAQALRVLERGPIDLLVTAIAMPVVDGIELLRHVANRGLTIPVIVATPHDPPPLVSRSPLRFVREPLQPAALTRTIREQLAAPPPGCSLAVAEIAQILALERRNCTLRAQANGVEGDLRFADGALVDAVVGGLSGDAAARVLLSWRRAMLRVDPLVRPRKPTTSADLLSLLPASLTADPSAAPTPLVASVSAALNERSGPLARLQQRPEHNPPPDHPAPSPAPEPGEPATLDPPPTFTSAAPMTPTPVELEPAPARPAGLAVASASGPSPSAATLVASDELEPASSSSGPLAAASPAPSAPTREPDLPAWERPAAQAPIAALLAELLHIDGAIGAGLGVWELDHCLDVRTTGLTLTAEHMRMVLSGHARVMRATMTTLTRLGQAASVQDILIMEDRHLHVLSPLPHHDGLFLDLVLDRSRSTLALARMRVSALLTNFRLDPAPA